MELFDVYPLFNITPVRAQGSFIWDDKGEKYLDLYGGHAVISVGHSHPYYIGKINKQLSEIGFYSNAVQMPTQKTFAKLLGRMSGYENYNLFLCNSGTEANENALKLASFQNGRKKIIAFSGAFHGRTSLSLGVTDDSSISAPVNNDHQVEFLPLNDIESFEKAMDNTVCAVIIEGIQGVGGINVPSAEFLKAIEKSCNALGAFMILDEIQSGYGRTGKFFAHQFADVRPHMITVAKGMGNGIPAAGVLIHPEVKPKHGMLGTTFGGNYIACAACISVLEIIEQEDLIANAERVGSYLLEELKNILGIGKVKGKGLIIGFETTGDAAVVRKKLLSEEKIFTGYSSGKNTIRLLPPLNLKMEEAEMFLHSLKKVMNAYQTVPVQ